MAGFRRISQIFPLKCRISRPTPLKSRRDLELEERRATVLYLNTPTHRVSNYVNAQGTDRNFVLRSKPFEEPAIRFKSPGFCTEMHLDEGEQHLVLWFDQLQLLEVRKTFSGQLVAWFDGFADLTVVGPNAYVGVEKGVLKVGELYEDFKTFGSSNKALFRV